MFQKTITTSLLITAALTLFASCNKSSDDSGGTSLSSLFKAAFPEEAAVSSPAAQKSASGISIQSSNGDFTIMAEASDTSDKKKEALTAILDGKRVKVIHIHA